MRFRLPLFEFLVEEFVIVALATPEHQRGHGRAHQCEQSKDFLHVRTSTIPYVPSSGIMRPGLWEVKHTSVPPAHATVR